MLIRLRIAVVAVVGIAGCGRTSPGGGAVAAVEPAPPAPQTPVAQVPAPPPAAFAFPADAAGRALPKVVTPAPPAPPPTERFGRAPTERPVPARIADPEPTGKAVLAAPPVPPARPAGLKPAAPPERVPVALGGGADGVPAKPALPESPGVKAKAPDVNPPPPLPVLGRPAPDRVSLDDPTAEPGNAAVVARPTGAPWWPAAFLRLPIPDPFELAEQVRPRVPPPAEPGLTPVPVNPQRVK